ncbi:MAG: MgtC/SapB family protein [Candidatus Woesearchaeota archaeon]
MLEYILRFVIVFILSMIFGVQRQKAHKPIGFGTFTFVAVGACALAIVASVEGQGGLLGAIVTGIGFLGAGALIKTSDKIFGFTSAASIWVFAIFGMLIGLGEYSIGIMLYILIWTVILVDHYLETYGIGSYQSRVTIITNRIVPEKELEALLLVKHKRIMVEVNKKENHQSMTYLLEGRKSQINKIPQRLNEKEWFQGFKAE